MVWWRYLYSKYSITSNEYWTFITDRSAMRPQGVVWFRNEVSTVTGSLNRMIARYYLPAHYMVVLEFVMC